jgi:hypothetical protein
MRGPLLKDESLWASSLLFMLPVQEIKNMGIAETAIVIYDFPGSNLRVSPCNDNLCSSTPSLSV